jgi:RNA polymerase sigma-70 factor (family 1)
MANYSSLSDQELTGLLKNGDKAAFAMIYQRYYRLLYIHALKKLHNEEEAKDIIQELFTTLWVKRENILQDTNFAAFLYTSVRNRVLDYFSHQAVASKYVTSLQNFIDTDPISADDYIHEKELLEYIQAEIQLLPAKMREVFLLSREENLSHREIANKLGISEQTVSKQVSNALKTLRYKMGPSVFIFFLFHI